MKKAVAGVAGMLLFAMCGTKDMGSPYEKDPVLTPDEPDIELPDVRNDTLYITGVEYPEGYDWVKDLEYGSVVCSLFVAKEKEVILKIPVGYEYETASDPDMHRFVAGHLYTDFSTSSETVIKKDGEVLFRYPGREMIVSFHEKGGNIHTIGEDRSGGGGFTYRKNGETVIHSSEGRLLSGIHEDEGCVFFAYAEPDGAGQQEKFYVVRNGEAFRFADDAIEIEDILAVRISDGRLCYVAASSNIGTGKDGTEYMLACGDDTYPLDTENYDVLSDCRILPGKEEVFVAGMCSSSVSGSSIYMAWDKDGVKFRLDAGYRSHLSIVEGSDIYDIVSMDVQDAVMASCVNGEYRFEYGRDRTVMGTSPAAVWKGKLYFIYTGSGSSRRAYIAEDDRITECGFNGYFTSVTTF